jgi:hypothetical protein
VIGRVAQFNGLSQITVDSIVRLATGRPLKAATAVDSLSEATESDLVKITGYQIVNPTQWNTGVGTGFTVRVSNGTRNIDLRIDNDCELFNQPVPTGVIESITGIGGQFDSSVPRNSGYQLFPRRATDIVIQTSVKNQAEESISIFPNPNNGSVNLEFPSSWNGQEILLTLVSTSGKNLATISTNSQNAGTDLSKELQTAGSGIYFLRATASGKSFNKILIKN